MRRRRIEPRLAIVDVETTGFSRHDRIVEFACVTLVDGTVVDEYETLIQPSVIQDRSTFTASPRRCCSRRRRSSLLRATSQAG